MDITILEDIGLTNAEIKVYLALLELGTTTAGPILDKSQLQNSVVHMTLHKLVEKGFASFIIKGKTRHYQAADPKNILNFIEEKKRKFESLIPELLIRQNTQEKQEAEIYEGFNGLKNALYELISDSKKDDDYLFFSFYTKDAKTYDMINMFYKEFAKERAKRGIIVKGIAPMIIKETFKGRVDYERMVFVDFPTPTNISIFGNKILFTPWEDKQICFLVRSTQLAESFRQYFYSIWGKYKKDMHSKNKQSEK